MRKFCKFNWNNFTAVGNYKILHIDKGLLKLSYTLIIILIISYL